MFTRYLFNDGGMGGLLCFLVRMLLTVMAAGWHDTINAERVN
jgi:hypothetical protein